VATVGGALVELAGGAGGAGDDADALLAALTAGAQDLPASRVLDVLAGTWRVEVEWEPIVGRGLRRSVLRAETGWIFGGRVLESRHLSADGIEQSRLTLAFDPTVGDYVGFAIHLLSSCFVLERGHHDEVESAIVLDAWEPVPGGRPPVHYRRTTHLLDADHHVVGITYPDDPPGRYGPMHLAFERLL
jgi:hypothetical protein